MDAVRTIFAKDGGVAVREGARGVVRIRIGDVSEEIFQTRILPLRLSAQDRYNPFLLFTDLPQNEDMAAALARLGLHPANGVMVYGVTPPLPRLPHLPATLRDITVDELLGTVARRFHGIVLYGACPQSGVFKLDFVPLARPSPMIGTQSARMHKPNVTAPPATPPSR